MSRDEIYLKLTSVFHEVFDNEDITLSDGMSAEDVDEWDSLSHIRLVVAVEEMFSIRFDASDVVELENVGQFVDLIGSKSNA